MRSEDILTVPISSVYAADWDVRSSKEDENGLLMLANSIKRDGFINPITCIKRGKKYEVIAGRRRLKAAKMIGLKEIPIYIKQDASADLDSRRVALIENLHRKDMRDSERGRGFLTIFQMAGYSDQQVIQGVKSIDNWFSDHTNHKTDWDKYIHKVFVDINYNDQGRKENPLRHDRQFVDICRDIGFAPKYQYQLMQLVLQLDPEVLKYAEDEGIATDIQIMLTTRPLRDHPRIQKELIYEIKNEIPRKNVGVRIQQVAKDLEMGYLELDEDTGNYLRGDPENRETIKDGAKVLEPVQVAHLDITKAINEFLFRMTSRSITKGEHNFSSKIIEKTKDHRISIVKVANPRTLISLQKDLILVSNVALDMLQLIEQEFQAREMKKDLEVR